jgi:hypothetical protein
MSRKKSECEKGYERWISPFRKPEPVFKNCNVCGRTLIHEDELAVGMCAVCANEQVEESEP